MYKKVYVEITNNCNLNCSFCPHNKREQKFITMDEFKKVLSKLKDHTEYLYFHVLGEPLLHPNINELIEEASKDYKINITTNGYLLKRIKDNKNIRQINISLQSYVYNKEYPLNKYLDDIYESIEYLKRNTYISLRLWVENEYTKDIISYLENKYNLEIDYKNEINNITLEKNIFLSFNKEFIWPSMDNEIISEVGTCYALRDHIGILVDGTVIPCCLDSDGVIKLGNIYESSIEEIINSKRYQDMLNGFKINKKCEELCQRCNFIE